jgi:small subunit ribosomal protein S18
MSPKTERGRKGGSRAAKRSRYREPTKCRFCRAKAKFVDYKDLQTLQKLTTVQGKLFSRKRSGNCAKHQRMVKMAVKRARYLALLPYVG